MGQTSSPASTGQCHAYAQPVREAPGLARVVYRSRAVRALSPPELRDLTNVAQRRNGREGVTGVMLYDQNHFFQWLEGPADGVGRVMRSICHDTRHTNLEVLTDQPVPDRQFADWSMKLATSGPIAETLGREVIEPPPEIVDHLRKQPEAAPALLVQLVKIPTAAAEFPAKGAFDHMPLQQKTAAILKSVFLSSVLPQLQDSGTALATRETTLASPLVNELAELLVATDQDAVLDLVQHLVESGGKIGPLSATLFEPAARVLGDLWREDLCSEFDVTLGLCRMQTAVRLLTSGSLEKLPGGLPKPVVLVVPEPGELHRLGATLDSSVLNDAGWSPHTEFPTDDNALDDLLSSQWFDVLDLSLSAAFRRDELLARMTKTIALARRASRNPALVVVVGGRVFVEEKAAGTAVGADFASTTARGVNKTILKTISVSSTLTAEALPTVS